MADNVKQILSLQAGQGANRQSVTVSINGAGAISKAARSGEVSTAMSIGHDAVTEEWEIVVPIIDSTGQPLMVVQGNRVRIPYTPLDMGIISMCASFFNVAAEHAKVLSTVHTRTFDEAVMESLTIEGAMKAVILSACKLCRCHNALVYWPSPEGSMCQYYMEGGQVKMKNYFTTMGIAVKIINSFLLLPLPLLDPLSLSIHLSLSLSLSFPSFSPLFVLARTEIRKERRTRHRLDHVTLYPPSFPISIRHARIS